MKSAIAALAALELVRKGFGMAFDNWVPWIRRRRFLLLWPMNGLTRRRLIHATPEPRDSPYTLLVMAVGICLIAFASHGEDGKVWPLRWGVDTLGTPENFELQPWAAELFKEFGYNFWVLHAWEKPQIAANIKWIREVDAWCRENGVTWVCDLESANCQKTFVDERGRDWFNRPDGRHFELLPDEILEELGRCQRLDGVLYDEVEHMQNCRNGVMNNDTPFAPWVYDPKGDTLEEAADKFTSAVGELRKLHDHYGLKLYTEHVFPVLFHCFARAGWTAGTKILKENWSPAFIACAMGAAIEYGTELWITPDLCGYAEGYPAHSVEEYRSALLLAYHMGADTLYTENLAYDFENRGKGSLVLLKDGGYTVTDYGKAAKWFIHEYVPAHPRRYTFRQLRPRVAIIRQEDACWGQATNLALGDRLFGNDAWPSTLITEAWLRIWHLLTRGVISAEGPSWHSRGAYSGRPYQVLCPLDGVVVFDEKVSGEHLKGVELIFLAGLGIAENTQKAVAERVAEGAMCISLPHLLPEKVRQATGEMGEIADGKGVWVATTDFLAPHVRKRVMPFLPDFNSIRYTFGDTTVVFRAKDGDPNRLNVEISPD